MSNTILVCEAACRAPAGWRPDFKSALAGAAAAAPVFTVKDDFIGGGGGAQAAEIPNIAGLNLDDMVEDDPAAAPAGGSRSTTCEHCTV